MLILRGILRRLETGSFRLADRLCVISGDDMTRVGALAERPILVPNPTDGRMFELHRFVAPRDTLRRLYGFTPPAKRFGLFVGSAHEPNRLAVVAIREFARDLISEDIGFVIAGACADPGRDGGVHALGRVDDAMLPLLYAACNFVVIPIMMGTGSSLKTVEAMAAGKPVLGTATAFRGLAVADGSEVVVEDDAARYPDRIRLIVNAAASAERLGSAARRFARAYDVRVAFLPYRDLLGLPSRAEPVPREGALDAMLITLAGRARDMASQ